MSDDEKNLKMKNEKNRIKELREKLNNKTFLESLVSIIFYTYNL